MKKILKDYYWRHNDVTQSTSINDILFDTSIVYRTNEPIELTAIPSGVTITDSVWEIRRMSNNSLVGMGIGNSVSIPTVTEEGLYKIKYTGKTATDQYIREWKNIPVLNPQFEEDDADIVINLASGNYYNDFAEADNSGLKIYVKGSGTAQIQFVGLFADANDPVRVQKEIGNTNIEHYCPNGVPHAIYLYGNNENILFDGFNTNKTKGWDISGHPTNSAQVFAAKDGAFTGIKCLGLNLSHVNNGVINAAAFSFIPVTNATYNASTYVGEDIWIIGCTTTNAAEEGAYIGPNNDGLVSGHRPYKIRNAVIAWCSFIGSGRDGIQPGSCVNISINNNYIDGWGVQQDTSHESAISWNGGTYGQCFENYCLNGEMFLNIQSGATPFDIEAGQTTPQKSSFYSNVFINGTYTGSPGSEFFAIYCQNSGSETTSSANWPVEIYNNIFKSDKKIMEAYFHASSFVWTGFKMVNNICVGVTSGGDYPELNFTGPGTQPTGTTINNIFKTAAQQSDIGFTDYANNDLTIASLNSIVYTGATDVSSYDGDYGVDGLPLNAGGFAYGAYSGYNKKTITPSVGDPDPATFSTPVAVGTLTQSGGTISYEANKVGVLYWVVIANGGTEPSTDQIRAGQNASGVAALDYGQILDSGTAGTEIITGLTEGTAYDLWCNFVTVDNIEQAANTKVDFPTAADVVAPTVQSMTITDANRDQIVIVFSEAVTGTNAGFTIAGTTSTSFSSISGTGTNTIIGTMAVAATFGQSVTLAYSSSTGDLRDLAVSPNDLATFGATSVTNNIAAEPEEFISWVDESNATEGSDGAITSTSTSSNARSNQIIPSTSNGYAVFTWDTISRSDFQGMRFGLIGSSASRTFANINLSLDLRSSNTNVDVYQGTTYKTTITGGTGIQATGYRHRFRIDRGTSKVYYETSPDGNTWTTRYTHDGTVTGDLRAGFVSGTSGKGVITSSIQADLGLT